MNFVFLRGRAKAVDEESDVWMDLFYHMLGDNDYGEMVCFGRDEFHQIDKKFSIRCIGSIDKYKPEFKIDFIFARGGFGNYNKFLKSHPDIKKMYYGAGVRYNPPNDIYYDIILNDCEAHLSDCMLHHPDSTVTDWIKPAHSNFVPPTSYSHEYDVCFIGNGGRAHKGHNFIKSTCPGNIKMLHLGITSEVDMLPNVTYRLLARSHMSEWIGKCKIGILPYEGSDSCPRAMSEMLACGIPVVALNTVNFWHNIYRDVIITDKENFWNTVNKILKSDIDHDKISIRYSKELSVHVAADYLKKLIISKISI